MKLKICGLTDPANIEEIQSLHPDYLGFIFYEKSPRCVKKDTLDFLSENQVKVNRVGVFVNESIHLIKSCVERYQLSAIQFHGNESPDFVKQFKSDEIAIIKAINVDPNFEFHTLADYTDHVDYFLFDTKTEKFGGSGHKFNWNILSNYTLEIPFFLAGGINHMDAQLLKNLDHQMLHACDVNSGFEISPGIKSISKCKSFIKEIRNENEL